MHGLTATAWGNPAAWLTASTSTVKLKVNCICCMVFMDGGPHSNWSLVTEPSVYTVRSCGLQFSWISLITDRFSCWPFSTMLSQFFDTSLIEISKSVWVPFLLLYLLELLQYQVLCFHPSKTYPVQVYTFTSFTASWSGLWRCLMALKWNDWADRLDGKATITAGLRLWRSKVLRSLRHYLP